MRIYLLEHPKDRIGVEYLATIGEQRRKRIDMKALANEIGPSLLQRFTTYAACAVVKLRERSDPPVGE